MAQPLAGLRVLDFTQYEAGTSATQTLAWLGADVVKVEPPGVGEPGRGRAAGPLDRSYFLTLNGNKRSVAINLKSAEGRDLLLRLLPRFHVVAENLGPGTMESLGLGEDELRRLHPSLIYASLKGFGTTGPHAHYRSYDMVAQAVGGSMSITGTAATEPMRSGVTYGDTGTGMQFAIGILAAYTRFLQTGEGGHVEVSMQDAIASYARVGFLARENVGDPVPRVGNNLRQLPPTNTYPCKPFGPNDYVYVVANTALMLERLFIAIGQPALVDDPRVATVTSRQENEEWLHGLIKAWTAERTKFEAMDQLQCAGIPAGAVYDSGDVFNDPHLIQREMIQQVQHPTRGTIEILGNPIRVDHEASRLTPSPLLGQHTEEVLYQELCLSADEVSSLREEGVV
ncbi:MAG: CoA transferase [Dehalococcoidia bacterium]|nr:CoA transferase [Dehalococcoidia bacterium]MCB9484545.1 CoA transferase [Thermoflexaceae bacterium]